MNPADHYSSPNDIKILAAGLDAKIALLLYGIFYGN